MPEITPFAPIAEDKALDAAIAVGQKEALRLSALEKKEDGEVGIPDDSAPVLPVTSDDDDEELEVPEAPDSDDEVAAIDDDEELDDEKLLASTKTAKPQKGEAYLKTKAKQQRERESIAEERGKLTQTKTQLDTLMADVSKKQAAFNRLIAGDPEAALELGVDNLQPLWEALATGEKKAKTAAKAAPKKAADLDDETAELVAWAKEKKAEERRAAVAMEERGHEEKALAIAGHASFKHIAAYYDTTKKRDRADLLAQYKIAAHEYSQETGIGIQDKSFFSAVAKRLDAKIAKEYADEHADESPQESRVPKGSGKHAQLSPSSLAGSSRSSKPLSEMTEDERLEHAIAVGRAEAKRLKAQQRDLDD